MRSLIRFFVAALLVSTAFAASAHAYPSLPAPSYAARSSDGKYIPLPDVSWAHPRQVTIETLPVRKRRAFARKIVPQWDTAQTKSHIDVKTKHHMVFAAALRSTSTTKVFDFKPLFASNTK